MNIQTVTLRPARPADEPAIKALLLDAELPVAGVHQSLNHFIVGEAGGHLVGVAGLETHGSDGVLRSVAVAPALRGQGLGARLTERVLEEARSEGLGRVYLLTTTAEEYFPRHGFRRIDRSDASEAVQASVEFTTACPASAVAMVVELS